MAGVFKAYDIRGIYEQTLTRDLVTRIGRAFVTFTRCRSVVVGRDMRPHSAPLFEALAQGLTAQGADVIDIGLCSTPMCYYACGSLAADAAIMITASHNPGEWNGMKLTREQAIPISGATGIAQIEKIVHAESFDPPAPEAGTVTRRDIFPDYAAHVGRSANLRRPIRIAADMANAMGIREAQTLEGILEIDPLFDDFDGTFPNHEANPLKPETLRALQDKVRAGTYDFGAAFDGDADRVGFVDEKGEVVPMDLIGGLISQEILRREKGVIFCDLRSSWAVREVIRENGGTPMLSRVGHAFIKQQMRDHDALFASELSGHYYYRSNYFTESSAMAVLSVANIVSAAEGRTLSDLIEPIRRYTASGELNLEVEDPPAVLEAVQRKYADGRIGLLDGVTVEYDDWWFNVRASNTEPLVRVNVEAREPGRMEEQRDRLLSFLRSAR